MDERDFERIKDQLPTPEEILSRLGDQILEAEAKLHFGGFSMGLYILQGTEPVPIGDTLAWAKWFEHAPNRRVADTRVNGWRVSTVFLGIDNNLFDKPPLLFETMIFSLTEKIESPIRKKKFPKEWANYCRRYASWDQAVAGHQKAVAMILEGAQ